MPNRFEGEKIRLRAYEPEDAVQMHRHLLDSEISRRDSEIMWPVSVAYLTQRTTSSKNPEETDSCSLVIETLDGRLIGGLSIGNCNRRNGTYSIGLGIAEPSEWGKGYAKEAMLLAMRHVFHELGYQKCNLGVYDFNARALNLYRRMGFVDEGRLRRNYYTAGAYYDEIQMGMTREEFDERYPEWHIDLNEVGY